MTKQETYYILINVEATETRGCSSMVEHQPSKLDTWVRFPSPALCDSGVVGNARPCQGRDRGFEPRLSLLRVRKNPDSFFVRKAVHFVLTFLVIEFEVNLSDLLKIFQEQ